MHANHCIPLDGRTYHYLRRAGEHVTNGLKYFCFDALGAVQLHGTQLNTNSHPKRCKLNILTDIYKELQNVNVIVQECKQIGHFAEQTQSMGININKDVIIKNIEATTSHLDFAAIAADNVTGNVIISCIKRRK